MTFVKYILQFLSLLSLEILCSDVNYIGTACESEKFENAGICRLLSDCPSAKVALIERHQLPQICGFQSTQPIVCCPESGERRVPGVISKLKCREYSAYAYEEGSNECGHKLVKRITNGDSVGTKEFAHMAAIGHENQNGTVEWFCSGSIISEYYILTSGYCLKQYFRNREVAKYVRVGMSNLKTRDHQQQLEVAEIIRRSNFTGPSRYDDIGLIKLKRAINLNSYARPACLYTNSKISSEKLIAIGWEHTNTFNNGEERELRKVSVSLTDYRICNTAYGVRERILTKMINAESQLCAGGVGGRGSCLEDIGGPLQMYHTGDDINCMYDIVGVTSYVLECGVSPAIYSRVSHYVKWIEDIVWPEST